METAALRVMPYHYCQLPPSIDVRMEDVITSHDYNDELCMSMIAISISNFDLSGATVTEAAFKAAER
jgi:hypothetical protein